MRISCPLPQKGTFFWALALPCPALQRRWPTSGKKVPFRPQDSSWFACDGCDRKLACIQEANCMFGHEEAGTLGSSTSSGFRESFNSKRLIGRQLAQPGRQHPASKTGDGRAYPAYRASSCAHIEGSVFCSLRRIQA